MMKVHTSNCSRRDFLRWSAAFAGAPLVNRFVGGAMGAEPAVRAGDAKVAIVRCAGYGAEVRAAMKEAFELLGGIGGLVKNKTVTVKLNLTGTTMNRMFDRPAGETYTTQFMTALALGGLLFDNGARRVRFVDSTQSSGPLEPTLLADKWDVQALRALGEVDFENTRNLGKGKRYAELKRPGTGYMFSKFLLNHAYDECDVLVSLCKLKQHATTGVTLSMKNMFGITPNSLYGDQAPSEDATGGRGVLHAPQSPWESGAPANNASYHLPGAIQPRAKQPTEPGERVPRIIADICATRPIHLSVIDGITSITGAEGPWCAPMPMRLVTPGVLVAGLNPVATDAVGTAVMGFPNPRIGIGNAPFFDCENHLVLAEQAGVGTADLAKIDVRGVPIQKAVHPYIKS